MFFQVGKNQRGRKNLKKLLKINTGEFYSNMKKGHFTWEKGHFTWEKGYFTWEKSHFTWLPKSANPDRERKASFPKFLIYYQ